MLLALLAFARTASAQSSPAHLLYGDFKVDESHAPGTAAPKMFNVILKGNFGNVVARQTVSDNGRFSFPHVENGEYDLVVELEDTEVARVHVAINQSVSTDIRQDISLEWRGTPGARAKPGTVAADAYTRSSANQSLMDKALAASKKKDYAQATALLRQIVEADPKDYEAWTELGTQQFNNGHNDDAEKSFARAAEQKPTFLLPYLNLGKLRLARKDYDGAVEALTKAVALTPPSADANYMLGESYLQLKRGSKAVPYFTEAIRLGKSEGHLRLAALYNAAGLRDRAATEYEQFLAKNPNHPDRKKFEDYIRENKKK